LLRLYEHPDIFVRLNAAHATLAIAPIVARAAIQKIADSKEQPAAGDAGMAIRMLDRGVYKPK
jgi:HEAT repeat protein